MSIKGEIRFAAILLSRQPRRPCGRDLWVVQTQAAILWLKQSGLGVISSVGIQTWELITALASIHKVPLRLVIPVDSGTGFDQVTGELVRQFGLSPSDTEMIPSQVPGKSAKNEIQNARDSEIANLADLILPVGIRPDGSMEKFLAAAISARKRVEARFQIEYQGRRKKLAYTLDHDRLSDEVRGCGCDYVIHWTRAVNGPWPGERPVDYYRELVQSDRHPRSAFDTLMRILDTRRLIASPRHMPRRTPVVAFSALAPAEVIPLMRWRARFGEMSFEPYGIGLRRAVAERTGIRPVQYGDKLLERSTPADYWTCQSPGTRADWREEQEYRHLGDLDFSGIPKDDLAVFCLTPEERAVIGDRFGLRTVSFY